MEPVRIAFDVGPEHGHRTGVGVTVHALRSALDERADVALVPYLLSWRTHPDPPTRRLALPAALAHRLWAHVDAPAAERMLGPFDVLHGTNYLVAPSRQPRLVSVYDCWFLDHPEQAAPSVRRAGAVLRRAVAAGATVHTSSHATADRVRDVLATERVEVIPLSALPVDPPATSADAPAAVAAVAGRPFVLALGTLERRKNLPALIAAFGHLAVDQPDLGLVLAGADGDDGPAVTTALAALPAAVRARVVRPGPVTAAVKAWLLGHARLLAYPSLDEGFGFPLLEAQQAGLPIVATRAGSIPEVGGTGVELVAVGDTEALAAALDRVASDEGRRAELIGAGHANLARFSWAATAAAMAALYRRMAGEGR